MKTVLLRKSDNLQGKSGGHKIKNKNNNERMVQNLNLFTIPKFACSRDVCCSVPMHYNLNNGPFILVSLYRIDQSLHLE